MKALFTAAFVSFFMLNAFAQEPIDKKKENNVEIITFGNDENDNENIRYKDIIIKTSPTAFIFGKLPFEIEKEITDYFSVQGGLGLTFSSITNSDLWRDELFDLDDNDEYCNSTQWGNNDYCDNPFDFDYRDGKTGIILSASGRLFWGQDGFDGGYIAPVVRYSNRRTNVQMIDETQGSSEVRLQDSFDSEIDKNVDLVVHYGAQYLNETITWEYFVGLGLRKQTRVIQDLGYDPSGNLRNGELQEIKRNTILYEIGLRVGFRL